MNSPLYTELIQLVEKASHEHLYAFIAFAKSHLNSTKLSELQSIVELFEKSTQPISSKSSKQCTHIFKRGNNIGKQCNVILKDGEHIFCSKHRTIEANQKIEQAMKETKVSEQSLQADLKAVLSEEEEFEEESEKELDDIDEDVDIDEEVDEETPDIEKCKDPKMPCLDPYVMEPEETTEVETEDFVEEEEEENDDEQSEADDAEEW